MMIQPTLFSQLRLDAGSNSNCVPVRPYCTVSPAIKSVVSRKKCEPFYWLSANLIMEGRQWGCDVGKLKVMMGDS